VHQQAFAKAIAIDDNKKSVVESLDLASMSKIIFIKSYELVIYLLFLFILFLIYPGHFLSQSGFGLHYRINISDFITPYLHT